MAKARQQYYADEVTLQKESRDFAIQPEIIEKLDTIEPGAQVNTVEIIKVNGDALEPDENKAVDISVPLVDDTLYSTSSVDALSARQGRILYDYLQNIASRGRYLSNWNAATGLAMTNPADNPYNYRAGDYYIVGNVAASGGTNYRPDGAQYIINQASQTVESQTVKVGDFYCYDGTSWLLLLNTERQIAIDSSLSTTSTNPVENRVVTGAINTKQDILIAGTNIQIAADGKTISATDTTYSSLPAAEGGVDVSLVTTGEKYVWNNKQDELIAGANISIAADGKTISAVDTTYASLPAVQDGTNVSLVTTGEKYNWNNKQEPVIGGTNVTISADGKTINAVDTTYSAGTNVQIDANNVISATDTTYTASDFDIKDLADTTGLRTEWSGKQDELIAGTNIQIAADGKTISATDTTYTAGTNIQINGTTISATDTTYTASDFDIKDLADTTDLRTTWSGKQDELIAGTNIQIAADGKTISATDTTYTAGAGISISNNNVISSIDNSAVWGEISGTLSNQTDLQNALNNKQDTLIAGTNIQIANDGKTISATDTTYTAGTGISIDANNVISNTQTSAEWGNITGTLSDQTDLQNALNAKQDELIAGTNIQIAADGKTISAIDTTYTASDFDIKDLTDSTSLRSTWSAKQDALIAGTNIQIAADGKTISATDTTYTASDFDIKDLTDSTSLRSTWSGKQDELIAGANIQIAADGKTISATDTTYTATDFDIKDLTDSTGLRTTWSGKQDTISDLATIRTGAGKGATAVQPLDNVSTLTNDAGYITKSVNDLTNYYTKSETYTKSEVADLVANFAGFKVVATLPTTDIKTNIIYLLGPVGSGADKYEEYIYSNNTWVMIGETSVDLTNYFNTSTQTSDAITEGSTNLFLTSAERTKLGNTSGTNSGDETKTTIQTKLGAASASNSGYLTSTDWSTFNGKADTTIIDDTAYASSWDTDTTHAPTKNAVYDKISAMDTTIGNKANTSDVLTKTNTTTYTPSENYHPATKKYVDDTVNTASGGVVSDTAYGSSWDGVSTVAPSKNAVYDKISAMDTTISGKQDTIIAGDNITIGSDGKTISATDTTYTAGTGIDITNGVISNTQTSAEWGNITGTLADQTDLKTALDNKMEGMTILTYGSSTWADFTAARDKNRIVYCKVSVNGGYRMAFLAYENTSSGQENAEFQYYRSISSHSTSDQGDEIYIYKLLSNSTWSTTTRKTYSKIVASTGLGSSYSNGTLTLTADSQVDDTAYGSGWDGVTATAPSKNAVYDKISAMDTTISNKANTADLGTAASKNTGTSSGNVPVLDSNGKLSTTILPALAITDTFTVTNASDLTGLTSAEKGDVGIVTSESKTYILSADPYSTAANWKELATPTDTVTSVNTKTGAVTLDADDISDTSTTNKFVTATEKSTWNGKADTTIVNDTAYGSGWNADTTHAPTKNAVYDKISAMDTTISGKADDSGVVHLAGTETITGEKTFSNSRLYINAETHFGYSGNPTDYAYGYGVDLFSKASMIEELYTKGVFKRAGQGETERTWTLPSDKSGTIALTSDLSGFQTTANLKTSLSDNSDSYYPSQKAVKTAVDAKQDALSTQTAYTSKGTATKVPTITTNTLGQVTGITETNITFPVTSVNGNTGAVTVNAVPGTGTTGHVLTKTANGYEFAAPSGGGDMNYADFNATAATGATVTMSLNTTITPSANFTVNAPSSIKDGQVYILRVTSGSTVYTMTLGTNMTNPYDVDTTLTANGLDQFVFFATGGKLELQPEGGGESGGAGITNNTTGTTTTVTSIWAGTEAEYASISVKDANVLYFTF